MAAAELLVTPDPGVYCWRNLINGKRYIGSTNSLINRRRQHRGALRVGRHFNRTLQRAWDRYGEDAFVFEVLEYAPEALLMEREEYWIKELRSLVDENGYNIARVVEGRHEVSSSVRKQISQKLVGRRLSVQHRERISQARKGVSPTKSWKWPEHRQVKTDASRTPCWVCGRPRAFRMVSGKRVFQKLCGDSECLRRSRGGKK